MSQVLSKEEVEELLLPENLNKLLKDIKKDFPRDYNNFKKRADKIKKVQPMIKNLRKLTEDEKQKVIFVLNKYFSEFIVKEETEYDVLMNKKIEEFKLFMLNDNDFEQVEALLEICNDYLNNEDSLSDMAIAVMYDMWLNSSSVWPVMNNPEWEYWEKLKGIKINNN